MTLATTALDDLEAIVEQSSPRINGETRKRYGRGTGPWQAGANIQRASASVARERKAPVKPQEQKKKPIPATREPFTPVEIFSYDDLLKALRNRVENLGVTQANVDALLGHADNYAQKVLSLRQTRRLGVLSLQGFLSALSVKLVLVEDPAALERNSPHYKARDDAHFRAARAGHDKAELVRWCAARGLTVEFGD
jgi:hypothetical protein